MRYQSFEEYCSVDWRRRVLIGISLATIILTILTYESNDYWTEMVIGSVGLFTGLMARLYLLYLEHKY